MRNFKHTESVYSKKIKTVTLKLNPEHVADPEGNAKARSADEVYEILKAIFAQLDDDQEHLIMLVLNISGDVSGFKVVSSGTQNASSGDPKIIFRNALMLGAVKIILAHNHPSGSLKPSTADIGFTEKVIEAGKAIDIPLVDHIIFTPKGYTSMRADRYCAFEAFA